MSSLGHIIDYTKPYPSINVVEINGQVPGSEIGSFVMNMTGSILQTQPTSITVDYIKTRNNITIDIPQKTWFRGGGAASILTSSNQIPASLRPLALKTGLVAVDDDGTQDFGCYAIDPNGTLYLNRKYFSNFTGSVVTNLGSSSCQINFFN